MPLLQKPRDPNHGIRRDLRRSDRRQRLNSSPLVETIDYLDAQETPRGEMVDEAIKLYMQRRHELKGESRTDGRRMPIRVMVSAETFSYIDFMRSAMTPGELMDEALRLHRQLNGHKETTA